MIADKQSIETSAAYSLDILPDYERAEFERSLRQNPELAKFTADFRELGADIILAESAPLIAPPVSVLSGALARIGADKTKPKRITILPMLLSAAAALVLFSGGKMVWTRMFGTSSQNIATTSAEPADTVIITKNGQTIATLNADERSLKELLAKIQRIERNSPPPGVIQDIARLKRELQSLRKADAERFSANPRVARTVVIEMVDPSTSPTDTNLSERVSDYIASGIELQTDPEPEVKPVSSGDESTSVERAPIIVDPNSQQEIDFQHNENPVFYPDFPAGSDSYEKIDDGRVWDEKNQMIWVETDVPNVFQAVHPPIGFDPDFIDDYLGIVPPAGILPGPKQAAVPVIEPEPVPVNKNSSIPAAPIAFSIYDETTGQGSVIVGNLAPPDDGDVYQLWMRNAADDQLVSVGILPRFETGIERFDFDLLGSGITPAGFMITRELTGGADQPSNNVILLGP
jgi:hypothetical protein